MNSIDHPQTSSQEIGKKVASNAAWNYLSFGLGKALNLVTVSILAHLLTPELFGVVALATLAIDYISLHSCSSINGKQLQGNRIP